MARSTFHCERTGSATGFQRTSKLAGARSGKPTLEAAAGR
jgi:hypothetical protein